MLWIQEPNTVLFYIVVGKQLLVACRRDLYYIVDTCVSDGKPPKEASCSDYMLVWDRECIRYICPASLLILYFLEWCICRDECQRLMPKKEEIFDETRSFINDHKHTLCFSTLCQETNAVKCDLSRITAYAWILTCSPLCPVTVWDCTGCWFLSHDHVCVQMAGGQTERDRRGNPAQRVQGERSENVLYSLSGRRPWVRNKTPEGMLFEGKQSTLA